MKRIDYYNLLPIEIREKALANTDDGMLKIDNVNIIEALAGGFSWRETPEGFEYWADIHEAIDDFYCKLEQIEKQFA